MGTKIDKITKTEPAVSVTRCKPLAIAKNLNINAEVIEELRGIITEGVFGSRWLLIETYHEVGKVLIEHENEVSIKQVAEELGQKERLLYQCAQFYKKYPDLAVLPQGKNISWHKIANNLLPKHKDEKKESGLNNKIKQFIVDLFPGDRRKEFIAEIIKEWENWK